MIPSIEQEIRDLHALLGSAQDPEGRAFVPLADAYRRAGDPDRALEVLGRGLERHPDLAAGYLMRALAFRDLADDAGAEAAYRQVLDLDGDNARALVGLGRLISGEDEEAERLVRRGVALDPRLASEGTPDRVPRHSTNPEIVGAESLAPLEWEVLEPAADEVAAEPVVEATVTNDVDAVDDFEAVAAVTDAVDDVESVGAVDEVKPEPVVEPAVTDDVPGPDMVHPGDAEAALLGALGSLPGLDSPEATGDGAPEALDIEWEVEEFYRSIPGAPEAEPDESPHLTPEPPDVDLDNDELVVDAWSLAPDGWTAEAEAAVAPADVAEPPAEVAEPPDAEHEIPIDLADLAPEVMAEPLAAMDSVVALAEDGDDDAVLPTRTLGELYARQGLTTEAIQVFRALADAEPTNLEHRARLVELEAGLAGGGRARVTPAMHPTGLGAPDPEDPPISGFFDGLLQWKSGNAAEGES